MICNFSELRNKEVINKIDGSRLGTICDFEVDTQSGQMVSLLILGKGRFFSALTETVKINWDDIKVIGDDTVLVTYRKDTYAQAKRKAPIITTINIPKVSAEKELTEDDFSEFE